MWCRQRFPFALVVVTFFLNPHQVKAVTHWVVTEDGRIQQQSEALYTLKRPYDLVALIHQEEEAERLTTLRSDLLARKKEIDGKQHLYGTDDDLTNEEAYMRRDRECRLAEKALNEIDFFVSTVLPLENKGISSAEFLDLKKGEGKGASLEPNCTRLSPLDFSVHAFEHLDGVAQRASLQRVPETGLTSAIPNAKNISDFANRISHGLKKNQTSWVLFNLAAFYWRIKGNSLMAVECLRRSLAFSPRKFKDVALVSLGNILHRGQHSKDAAVVVGAAVDISPEFHINHFTLGNIYAVIGDYDQAALCFEHTTRILPEFQSAHQRLHAVRCQKNLEKTLDTQQRILESALEELETYQKDFETFQERHEFFLNQLVSQKEHNKQTAFYSLFKSESSSVIKDMTKTVESAKLPTVVVSDVKAVKKTVTQKKAASTANTKVAVNGNVVTENDIVNAAESKLKKKTDRRQRPYTLVDLGGGLKVRETEPEPGEKPPRFRLRVVKVNESDVNSPRSIRIEVADDQGRFPGDPGREPAKKELEEKEEPEFIDEYELTIRSDGTVVEEDDKSKEEDDDIWKHVVGRTETGGVILDTGEVLENKHPPRIVFSPAPDYTCKEGRGLACIKAPAGEEIDHKMRIKIEQLEAPLGRAINRHLSFGMLYASKRHTLTYFALSENRRYEPPRKRKIDELVAVYPTIDYMPDYDVRPRLSPTYSSQRKVNETRAEARKRRRKSQDRVERIPAMFRVPEGAAYDVVSGKLKSDVRTHIFIPTMKACVEYFRHLPSIDDYPSAYLPPESRGGNVSRILSLGLLPGNMHHHPWMDPVCVDYGDEPSPLHAFDHLIGVQYRDRLSFLPEPQMKPVLTGMLDPDAPLQEVGQRIRTAFEEAVERGDEKDFWVLFNLAGLYFRVLGNPYHAIECFRRALHYSPYKAKDVALIQLANVLRRVGHLTDAASVTHAALAIHPFEPLSHFTLGTIYGSKGRRNEGGMCSSFCVDMIPDFRLARRLVQSLFCAELFSSDEKRIHAELREELKKRQKEEGKEPTGRPEFTCTMSKCEIPVSPITKTYGAVTTTAATLASFELPEYKHKSNPSMKPYMLRWLREDAQKQDEERGIARVRPPGPGEEAIRMTPATVLMFQGQAKETETETEVPQLSMRGQPSPILVSSSPPFIHPDGAVKLPIREVQWAVNDYAPIPVKSDGTYKARDEKLMSHPHTDKVVSYKIWPSLTECVNSDLVNVRTLLSTWISPEMKGINIRKYINFDEIFNTARMWPVPECKYAVPNNPYTLDHLLAMQYRDELHSYNYTAEVGLVPVLKSFSGSSDVWIDEIAIRLDLALAKNESSWVLAELASLYWRVVGNASQAIQCLRVSLYLSPRQYRHFALTGLANVFIRTGFYDDAITALQLSNEIAPEVITNHFLMANALSMMGYYEDAVLYYESTLLHQADFPPAKCRLKTTRCMLMLRYIMQLGRDLFEGNTGVTWTKERGDKMKVIGTEVIDWLLDDAPLPLEMKPLCVFSNGNERYC